MEASASSARTPGTSSARARETRQATPPMARIAGVDIPREKRLEISLTYIFGIGRTTSQKICDKLGLDRNTRVRDLTDEEVNRIRDRKSRRVGNACVSTCRSQWGRSH